MVSSVLPVLLVAAPGRDRFPGVTARRSGDPCPDAQTTTPQHNDGHGVKRWRNGVAIAVPPAGRGGRVISLSVRRQRRRAAPATRRLCHGVREPVAEGSTERGRPVSMLRNPKPSCPPGPGPMPSSATTSTSSARPPVRDVDRGRTCVADHVERDSRERRAAARPKPRRRACRSGPRSDPGMEAEPVSGVVGQLEHAGRQAGPRSPSGRPGGRRWSCGCRCR